MKSVALLSSRSVLSTVFLWFAAANAHASGLSQWTPRLFGVTNDLLGVAYGAGRFVTVGTEGAIFASTDGAIWLDGNSPTTATLHGVTYGAGTFVAIGERGTIITSTVPGQWVSRASTSTGELFSVTYGGGQFVAVGRLDTGLGYQGVVLTSPDAVIWTRSDSGVTDPLYAVAYGAGKYVVVGHLSAVRSTNGILWQRISLPNYGPVLGIAYGNNRFVTAENDIYTPTYAFSDSESGDSWSNTSAGTDGAAYGVAFGSGVFAGVGGLTLIFGNPTNRIAVSANGHEWTTYSSGVLTELRGIAFGAEQFVAVGLSGVIVQSGRVVQSQLVAGRTDDGTALRITLLGEPGIYRLQGSTNLTAEGWSDVLTLTNTIGAITVTNPAPPTIAYRFFRAVSQ